MSENCWEATDCPAERRNICPAYPDNGKNCWVLMEALCHDGPARGVIQKIRKCKDCLWFKELDRRNGFEGKGSLPVPHY